MSNHTKCTDQPDGATRWRIPPPVYLLVAIAVAVVLHIFLPVARVAPHPWNLLAIGVVVAGHWPAIAGVVTLRRHGTTVMPFRESNALVTAGPYRLSRNPMYLGMVVILAGLAASLGTLSPWAVLPVFVVVITRRFIAYEERMLAERFGEDYAAYRRRVRRWV